VTRSFSRPTTSGQARADAADGALGAGVRWPDRLTGLAFGGDYNAEQWPESVWEEDFALMREAGVSIVTVGVFSWAMLEPSEGDYDFGWLDRLLDGLHEAGILVDLATPTAAPPAWFSRTYPQSLPVTRDGQVLGIGARESFCPSSPDYRRSAVGIARALGERYGAHPALALWHVHNEYGAHVGPCYCETSAVAFRAWLRRRYGTLDSLNDAWGTTFWSQRYGDWEEITPPRRAPMPVNPAQQLDFMRFSNAEYLACYRLERDTLRELSPQVPVTTNFMTTTCKHIDYWSWAREVDVVCNDHYLIAGDPDNHVHLAMTADLTRGLAGGRQWLLLEHSTGAVNWQPRNVAKAPGEMRRNSLTHIARGSDGAMFFQWRASRFGAEKFHSAMLPHAGSDSRLWRELVALGGEVAALGEVHGARVHADVAIIWDWESWWALELEFRPTTDLRYLERMRAFYGALWSAKVTVDFVPATADLSAYRLVVAPSLYLMSQDATANLTRYVEAGGQLLVSFFSGIVDEHDTIPEGPHPGALRDLLGLVVEEFHPLYSGQSVAVEGGTQGDVWSERILLRGAETEWRFLEGPDAGEPAVTRHRVGRGAAWYVGTRLDQDGLEALLAPVLAAAGVAGELGLPAEVEAVRRHRDGRSYLFLVNHGDAEARVAAVGSDLLDGSDHDGAVVLPPGGVRVLLEHAVIER
jgi:beta-galactosidase